MVASRFGWWFVAKAPCPTRAADASPPQNGNSCAPLLFCNWLIRLFLVQQLQAVQTVARETIYFRATIWTARVVFPVSSPAVSTSMAIRRFRSSSFHLNSSLHPCHLDGGS